MYTSEFCDMRYIKDCNVVFVKWKKFCCKEEYRAPLLYALSVIQTNPGCNYVADTKDGFENIPEDTQWVADFFVPEAAAAGCRYVFFIIDKENSLQGELEGQAADSAGKIDFRYVLDLQEVKEFLSINP